MSGQQVSGAWAGVGGFKGSADLSTFTVTLNMPSAGFKGTVKLTSNAAHHFACNSTTDPYFSSAIPSGTKLTDAEALLYTQLGWAITTPGTYTDSSLCYLAIMFSAGATSHVDMTINGTKLHFTGLGYHDASWLPQPFNAAVSTWYFGQAQVGEYDISCASVTPTNSTKILNIGYLSHRGIVLQNQCSIDGTKQTDRSSISPYGLQNDTVAGGINVPTGFIVEYILANGEKFKFNLSSVGGAQNPDQNVYHRWAGKATGGKVGENKAFGLAVFEWLNPGLENYNP